MVAHSRDTRVVRSAGRLNEPRPAIVEARVRQFRSFLLARPERCIAVVGHGTFFFHLTGKVLANCEVAELELAS